MFLRATMGNMELLAILTISLVAAASAFVPGPLAIDTNGGPHRRHRVRFGSEDVSRSPNTRLGRRNGATHANQRGLERMKG